MRVDSGGLEIRHVTVPDLKHIDRPRLAASRHSVEQDRGGRRHLEEIVGQMHATDPVINYSDTVGQRLGIEPAGQLYAERIIA